MSNRYGNETREINLNDPNQVYQIDPKMGDPYIKLKIDNLMNFKKEPLENYDMQRLFEDNAENINHRFGESRGMSKFMNEDGRVVWRPCDVLEFDAESGMFLIRWRDGGQTKHVLNRFTEQTRLTLSFENRYRSAD